MSEVLGRRTCRTEKVMDGGGALGQAGGGWPRGGEELDEKCQKCFQARGCSGLGNVGRGALMWGHGETHVEGTPSGISFFSAVQ